MKIVAVEDTRNAETVSELPLQMRRLLHDPIVPVLLRMSWPNILIMLAQAATGLIETWWVSRLGTEALAGMALVFPVVMLTQMIATGAMGGGISSAIARALGGGRRDEADALVLHAVFVNGVISLVIAAVMLSLGRPIYRALGGSGAELEAALTYSHVVFGGNVLLWLMNALASVVRGSGNMLVPALVTCVGVFLLVPVSGLLIFGFGPLPALGIAGGGVSLLMFYAGSTAFLGWYILSGRNPARFHLCRLRWTFFRDILRVGGLSSIQSIQTNVTIALSTALVAGTTDVYGIAGFGTGARLEYLLVPLVFGLGAPMVSLVGTNMGAGQKERALRIALIGSVLAFCLTETIGLAAAFWPERWLALFSDDPAMLATGSAYLRIVGPTYGFFGLALSLHFASQGAGRLFWPLCCGALRVFIAVGGGWAALRMTSSLNAMFTALASALVFFGVGVVGAIWLGAWGYKPRWT